jgi:hypothetical protein
MSRQVQIEDVVRGDIITLGFDEMISYPILVLDVDYTHVIGIDSTGEFDRFPYDNPFTPCRIEIVHHIDLESKWDCNLSLSTDH